MTWQWDDVRFFLAVARTGSLSRAARALGVGHVTVGRRITALERRLGVTLMNRTPDGFATTSAGEAILRQCAAMEGAAMDLERIVAGRDSLVTGSVRVTTTEALAYQLVAPAIAAVQETHPELRVDLIAGVRSLDIARREADLAVRFARPSASDLIFSQCDPVHTCSTTFRNIIGNATDGRAGLVVAFVNPFMPRWSHERCHGASANFVREIGK